ncbi:hypothetical protein Ccrd_018563 [Cynara cardunculus var. scolymus]|uniref:Bromodomain associated domain-containing protein n=1 Tax=Cynara cardunculus var. scolymus TaxID=59895 RepID=A0A103Y5Z6_CYNCS|nr:hypothetical protein Ccrd_018563 [Cynara cardunculus var. scolymus]
MALLGDDGRGYELARKLESQGVWRSWLGDDSIYTTFIPFLSTPSSWESFMRTDETKSRAQIQLQLRVRALLFDKACVSLFPWSNRSSSSSNSKLNPNYLQLHGDDVYFTLENPTQNVAPSSKVFAKAAPEKGNVLESCAAAYCCGYQFEDKDMDDFSNMLGKPADELGPVNTSYNISSSWIMEEELDYLAIYRNKVSSDACWFPQATPAGFLLIVRDLPGQPVFLKSRKVQLKASLGVGSRYVACEDDSMSQRSPESWYTQFFEKYRATKPYRLPSGDRESEKRTPEQMSNYLRTVEKHKRSRAVFMEEQNMSSSSPMFESGSSRRSSDLDDETLFFPETMFSANSVPDSALPPSNQMENVQSGKSNGVLDTLPPIMTKSPIMLERLGIRPEYLNMEQGNHDRGKSGSSGMKNNLSPDQAAELSRQVVSRLLMDVGFDSASGGPLDIFAQLFGCHISKLGRILKVLADSYRKECSAIELLKMFLQTIGHGYLLIFNIWSSNMFLAYSSNLGAFAELVKDSTKNHVQQTQLQVQAIQSQMQLQNQTGVRQPHQFPRQMHNQMVHSLQQQQQQQQQQMVHPIQQQQQWDRMRRRQPSTPRPVMNMSGNMNVDNESQRSMVEVKLENPPDFPMDNNAAAFATMNYRNPQMQNMGMVRAPPVKVEAFQELMGGDSSMKHDSEESKLTSPK